jgi:catechol 2,3-dioxygenase-like lactoylglutathione lyase family enzyme
MSVLTWLGVPGDAQQWSSLGFTVDSGRFVVGRVACDVGVEAAWGFDELNGPAEPLGVDTRTAPVTSVSSEHPNTVATIDHVVYTVPDLDEAVGALTEILGAEPRRRFKPRGEGGPEMAFYRVGEAFVEVVASGRPASLMGVAFMCPDLDACVAAVREAGGMMSDPKPAVQGGRISSVPRDFGLSYGVAVMDKLSAS